MYQTLTTDEAAQLLKQDTNAAWTYQGARALVEYLEQVEEEAGGEAEVRVETMSGEDGALGGEAAESGDGSDKALFIKVAETLIYKGADVEMMQCGFGLYLQVYSADYLAGLEADLEMYDTVSKAIRAVKLEHILSRTGQHSPPKKPDVEEVLL